MLTDAMVTEILDRELNRMEGEVMNIPHWMQQMLPNCSEATHKHLVFTTEMTQREVAESDLMENSAFGLGTYFWCLGFAIGKALGREEVSSNGRGPDPGSRPGERG